MLTQLRAHVPPLVERQPGVFYVRGTAFLHFHDDPAGLFADLRLTGNEFVRYPVRTAAQQRAVVSKVARHAATLPGATRGNAR